MSLEPALLSALVDRAFGGQGRGLQDDSRPLTQIELNVVGKVVSGIVSDLEATWGERHAHPGGRPVLRNKPRVHSGCHPRGWRRRRRPGSELEDGDWPHSLNVLSAVDSRSPPGQAGALGTGSRTGVRRCRSPAPGSATVAEGGKDPRPRSGRPRITAAR